MVGEGDPPPVPDSGQPPADRDAEMRRRLREKRERHKKMLGLIKVKHPALLQDLMGDPELMQWLADKGLYSTVGPRREKRSEYRRRRKIEEASEKMAKRDLAELITHREFKPLADGFKIVETIVEALSRVNHIHGDDVHVEIEEVDGKKHSIGVVSTMKLFIDPSIDATLAQEKCNLISVALQALTGKVAPPESILRSYVELRNMNEYDIRSLRSRLFALQILEAKLQAEDLERRAAQLRSVDQAAEKGELLRQAEELRVKFPLTKSSYQEWREHGVTVPPAVAERLSTEDQRYGALTVTHKSRRQGVGSLRDPDVTPQFGSWVGPDPTAVRTDLRPLVTLELSHKFENMTATDASGILQAMNNIVSVATKGIKGRKGGERNPRQHPNPSKRPPAEEGIDFKRVYKRGEESWGGPPTSESPKWHHRARARVGRIFRYAQQNKWRAFLDAGEALLNVSIPTPQSAIKPLKFLPDGKEAIKREKGYIVDWRRERRAAVEVGKKLDEIAAEGN